MNALPNWRQPPAREVVTQRFTVDHDTAMRLVPLLLEHGATTQQHNMYRYTARDPKTGQEQVRLCSDHTVTFPAGSMRYDGLLLHTSKDFKIVFPDGFEVRGIEQSGMTGGPKTYLTATK